ncbi:MAG TPA: glycoside hydrolase family 9 protein [Bacteroidales bacterium]|nr:glycoside hydrolase family 9 protein [Bacteroidales bacterium]
MNKIILKLIGIALIASANTGLSAQKISRDLNVDLLINHAGYLPGSSKTVVTKGTVNGKFDVFDIPSMKIVYTGSFKPTKGDFGDYSTGDFSAVKKEGHYYIKADTLRSFPFSVSSSAYRPAMDLIVRYFSMQRCGASTTGYLTPCHTDDGIRMDNGKHQDVSGGWHDASDLRKWVGATIYGMIGLSKTYELDSKADNNRNKILEELLWGNQYFLKMQEPQGYIMSYVGGDVKKHSDSNRWTDNEIGPEGGELKFVKPTAGRSTADMLIFGSNDDRVIHTDPLDLVGQYNFVTAEAIMARITKSTDNVYSEKCLAAAKKCFDWCLTKTYNSKTGIIGASIQAALEMYKTSGNQKYKTFAVSQAGILKKLQVTGNDNEISGFFRVSTDNNEPYKNIWEGCLEIISLCDMVKMFPDHNDAASWKEIISNYANHYLGVISSRNNFGIVPFGLFSEKDPGGNRRAGQYWYRYFMQPELSWWVGINSNLASAGVGLLKASQILNDPKMKYMAQRQLDWIVGINPFNSSTVVGTGYNHPKHFPGSTFLPNTPVIPGAVLNGLGGSSVDQPEIGNGSWQISEYWTPMVAYTIWLMAELTSAG